MAKLILHNNQSLEEINNRRLLENFALTPEQRIKKMFELIKMSIHLKGNHASKRVHNGIILNFK